jgi:exonuclease III
MLPTQNKPRTQRNGLNFEHGNRKVDFKIVTWNILSLYRSGACQNLVELLGAYKVKIAALQEIRWKRTGQVPVKDYEIYFSGMVDRHSFGSGFTVHKSMVPRIKEFRPISEKIVVMRIKSRQIDLILICVHAPTETSEVHVKDAFYEDLDTTYERLPGNVIKILLGDLNAKCGKEEHFLPIIESESVHDTSNDNGLRVISFAASKDMIISSRLGSHQMVRQLIRLTMN